MTKNILFIAAYPTVDKQKEGMFQRIKAIDAEFEAYNRTYLSISLVSHKSKTEEIIGNVRIVYVNWFIHFVFISKMIKSADYICPFLVQFQISNRSFFERKKHNIGFTWLCTGRT